MEIRDLAVYDALLGDTAIAAPGPNVAPGASPPLEFSGAAVLA